MPETTNSNTIKIRLIDEHRKRKFREALQHSFIHSLSDDTCAQVAFSRFYQIFHSLYDKFFPIITKAVKEKSILKPWVTETLIKRIKIRDSLSIKCNRGLITRDIFTRFRNCLNAQLKHAKSRYFQAEFAKCHSNGRKTWKIINSNINKNTKSKNVSLKENDNLITKEHVSGKFIEFFSNIPNQLVNSVPSTNINPMTYLKDRNRNSFLMSPIVAKELETAISQIKDSNPLFSISSSILDYAKFIISPYLSNIYNMCIFQGYFPSELKIG